MKKALIVIICFVMCAAVVAQESKGKDLNTLYREGMKALQDKDHATYLQRFKTLDEMRSNHPTIMYHLAAAYALHKKEAEALAYLKKLMVFDANKKILSDTAFDHIKESADFKEIAKRIKELHQPEGSSTVAFTIKERDLHPESIAYDPVKKRFYLSSIHKRKIVYIAKDSSLKDFTAQGQDGLDAVLGIRIDAKNRLLWATSSALPNMAGFKKEDKGRTGVFAYHLDTGKLVKKYTLNEGPDHHFDDVAFHPGGDVYVSDARQVYRINSKSDKLEPFYKDEGFLSLQGLAFCDNGLKMFAADWTTGLYLIDVEAKKRIAKVSHPEDISLKGIDGLYYQEESNSLIAIHNGLNPMRVMQYYLSPDFAKVVRVKSIEWANPHFNEPTLGVIVNIGSGNEFYYLANSQWRCYDKDNKILPWDKLQDIIILKTPL